MEFYIDGRWVAPVEPASIEVINPATEQSIGHVSLGSAVDVDRAAKAATTAFSTFSRTTKLERLELLRRVIEGYQARLDDIAESISQEMGAPMKLAKSTHAPLGLVHLNGALNVLEDYAFDERRNTSLVVREPIGACGFITPWNWPMNQIMCKVAPALATGCTMVLKPSEITPGNATIVAEVLHEAGVPPGVFNLVHGDGPGVGASIAAHPDLAMVSFTGSTRAGVLVAKAAADTVKRVTQELGGKSANIVLPDADLDAAIPQGVRRCFNNSGQSCNAPTRMFVHASQQVRALALAKETATSMVVGDPVDPATHMGPVASRAQFEKIQELIEQGIDEGAELVCGGTGRPDGIDTGYYVKPTVFGNVDNGMTIAREEIFGPVLAVLPYKTEQEAIALANDTDYGLSGYVQSGDLDHALAVARELRTGMVHINGAPPDFAAPFGGYNKSGNGREWGREGFEEFLEVKALMGAHTADS